MASEEVIVYDDHKQSAERFKSEGNTAFNENHFDKAVSLYSKAIEADPTNAVYWANRAFCHIKLENYGSALQDAEKSISLNPKYVKGYYRRGTAHFALGKLKAALKDMQLVCNIAPNDKDAKAKLRECRSAVMAREFAKAIESERTLPPSETVDVKSMTVTDSYEGPRLDDSGIPTLDFVKKLIEHFKQQKKLPKKYVYQILLEVLKILRVLPTLVEIDLPVNTQLTVCGDVHGQYYDLLNIFEMNGLPSETNPYLFNGDFVDRGSFSVEIIVLFFALKILYPQHFHLTRGNHESKTMNSIYGFLGEVKAKVDDSCFDLFSEVFCYLPLAYLIKKKVLVVHGGLFSEDGVTLDDIRKIDRVCQPPDHGLMCEIMWSDPQPEPGRAPSKRGVGLSFGPDITHRFLKDNSLDYIIRSHEVKAEGYEVEAGGKLITVFSAPNYCDQMGNKGAFIKLKPDLKPNFVTFSHVPHPAVRPMQYANRMMGFGL